MKFLADVNVEKPIIEALRLLGYDIKWIAEDTPCLDDISIFKIAQKEDRILL